MSPTQPFCRQLAAKENAAGSAARASCWLLLEQVGSWGKKAAVESDLDPALGAQLDARTAGVGGRFGLIRTPAQRAHHATDARTVLIAGNLADRPWLVRGQISAPSELLGLHANMLTAPTAKPVLNALPTLAEDSAPVALVCTNGKRDVCCAIAGRPLASQAATLAPGQVFETSHTGGHRFAPTGVLLPSGLTFARLDATDLVAALTAAARGELHQVLCDVQTNRGLCVLAPWEQAALVALQTTLPAPVALGGWQVTSTSVDGDQLVTIRGHAHAVTLRMRRQLRPDLTRPASCGAEAKPAAVWQPVFGDFSTKHF